ncbi:MAG TPA: glycosyltransferase family 1 protein [Candidatus Didemnitutus sp.]|nr:glycosyltransferase family 1 protein [Candidatus Didemnitutus sp.]
MRRVIVINPLESDDRTGMARAAEGLAQVMPEGAVASRFNRWFRRINRLRPAMLRQFCRLFLAQLTPLFCPRDALLVFSSHHAPLWRTGRHAVIIHDLIALRFPQQSRSQTRYYRRVLPRVLRAATRVVTISEAMRGELTTTFPEISSTAVFVVPSYVSRLDDEPTAGTSLAERRRLGQLAFVGARYRHKNLTLVLRALCLPEAAELRMVVTGCLRGLWPELAAFETAHRVEILDFASEANLDRLYATSLALVYPSLAEGQGLPPLEAMRSGCPVICADIPVLRETCGEAAFYVDPGDASGLAALLGRIKSGALDEEMTRKIEMGRAQVGRFQVAATRARWIEFMESFS